uniref:Net-like transcription factor n=1 Tax=Podocoryna carnea TaxID=6096 RepID=Q8I7T6_PODCA|nr:Net-like transcription factor [Podocoryna carnea]
MNEQNLSDVSQFTAISTNQSHANRTCDLKSIPMFTLQTGQEEQTNFNRMRRNMARVAQRDRMREAYENLREVVPTLNATKKPTQAEILMHTCEYVIYLKKIHAELKEEKGSLIRNDNLNPCNDDNKTVNDRVQPLKLDGGVMNHMSEI